MYATQSSRLGVPRHATVSPLSRIRFLPSTFARGFRLASMLTVPSASHVRASLSLRCSRGPQYEATQTMSRLRLAAPDAGFRAFLAAHTRDCCLLFGRSQRWTAGASYFRYVPAEPHQTVQFLVLWMPVDKWISCGLPMGLDNGVEHSPREEGTPRDESGEVRARRRPRREHPQGHVGGVDTAGGDEVDAAAESIPQAAHVVERLREESGTGEATRLLREAWLVQAARVAAVDDVDPGIEGRGDRRLLVHPSEIRRHLDDEGLVGGIACRAEHRRELRRPLRPRVDELRVGRRDVDLDEIAERRQSLDDRDDVLRRFARGGDNEGDPVRQVR